MQELEKNGATIFYGEHGCAAAVMDSAKELETGYARYVKRPDAKRSTSSPIPKADLMQEP